MPSPLSKADQDYLQRAIELSRHSLEDEGKAPFGAIVVVGEEIVGAGTSSVVELCDTTAHAEVMALRNAGARLRRHLFPDGVMYSSSEPCPMCLVACYWARLPRLVYGATSYDVAVNGFEDLQLYRQLTYRAEDRELQEQAADAHTREQAVDVLRSWASQLPEPVEPKL